MKNPHAVSMIKDTQIRLVLHPRFSSLVCYHAQRGNQSPIWI